MAWVTTNRPPANAARGAASAVKVDRVLNLCRADPAGSDGNARSVLFSNGAGKTTLFNAITGVTIPTEGRVVVEGMDLTKAPQTCGHAGDRANLPDH